MDPQNVTSTEAAPVDEMTPSCAKCAELGPGHMGELSSLDEVDKINAQARFADYHFAEANASTHHIAKLTAIYELAKIEYVTCDFPDHTAHGYGFIIDTQCGMRLRIGNDCAKTWLVDSEHLLKRVRSVRSLQASHSRLLAEPNSLVAKLAAVKDFSAKCESFRDKLKVNLPKLHTELERRRQMHDGAKFTVTIPAPEQTAEERARGEAPPQDRREQLTGLQVGNTRIRDGEHRRLLDAVNELRAEVAQGDLRSDVPRLKTLGKKLDKIDREVKTYVQLVDDARQFFTERNMTLLEVAADPAKAQQAMGAQFRYQTHGGKYRLGLDGLFKDG